MQRSRYLVTIIFLVFSGCSSVSGNSQEKYFSIKDSINNLLISTKKASEKLKISSNKQTNFKYGKEFYVSTSGDDANSGTFTKPFKTIVQARDSIRKYKKYNGLPTNGIAVWIRNGSYDMTDSLLLSAQDSGTKRSPITYSAYKNEKVSLIGGKEIPNSWFKLVNSNDPLWNRLDPNIRDKIQTVDLSAKGIVDLGSLNPSRSYPVAPIELFESDEAFTLARWPNKDEHTNLPTINNDVIHIYGDLSPNISGKYVKKDSNIPLYLRDGLVNGKQYSLTVKSSSTPIYWKIVDDKERILWHDEIYSYNSLPRCLKYPSRGSTGIPCLLNDNNTDFGFALVKKGLNDTSFKYTGDKPSKWFNTGDIWINGMLKYGWSNGHSKIKNINPSNNTINLKKAPLYGVAVGNSRMPYYAYNIIEELNSPGEYFIDKKTSKLYVLPKKVMNNNKFYVSMNKTYIIDINGASWINLKNLTIKIARNNLVRITNGSHNIISHCTLSNSGTTLIKIDGYDNGIEYSDLSSSGDSGLELNGGIRKSLTPSNNFAKNNNIHNIGRWNFTYRPAIKLDGVGNIVENNNIHDLFHSAILYNGNNNVIQYNNIYDVLKYTTDAGVIYSGRDWGWRGNKINYNFIHDIKNNYGGRTFIGVYFDDSISGNEVIGNIFYNLDGLGVFINGGKDTTVKNNIFDHVGAVFHGNNSGVIHVNSSFKLFTKLNDDGVNYKSEPWASAYPRLYAMPDNWSRIKNEGWLYPIGNSFKNNVALKYSGWTTNNLKGTYEHYKDFDTHSVDINDYSFKDIDLSNIGIIIP